MHPDSKLCILVYWRAEYVRLAATARPVMKLFLRKKKFRGRMIAGPLLPCYYFRFTKSLLLYLGLLLVAFQSFLFVIPDLLEGAGDLISGL